MPEVGFETMTPVFERGKTVHALDRAATVIGGQESAPVPLCPPQIPHDQTPGSNPGRRGGKPATNRLSYGAAFIFLLEKNPKYIWDLVFTINTYVCVELIQKSLIKWV
jgi:hypothetical protein